MADQPQRESRDWKKYVLVCLSVALGGLIVYRCSDYYFSRIERNRSDLQTIVLHDDIEDGGTEKKRKKIVVRRTRPAVSGAESRKSVADGGAPNDGGIVNDSGNERADDGSTGKKESDAEFSYRLPVREDDPLTAHYRDNLNDVLQKCYDSGERGAFFIRYTIDNKGNPLKALPQSVSGSNYASGCAKTLSEILLDQDSIPGRDGIFTSTVFKLEEE